MFLHSNCFEFEKHILIFFSTIFVELEGPRDHGLCFCARPLTHSPGPARSRCSDFTELVIKIFNLVPDIKGQKNVSTHSCLCLHFQKHPSMYSHPILSQIPRTIYPSTITYIIYIYIPSFLPPSPFHILSFSTVKQ